MTIYEKTTEEERGIFLAALERYGARVQFSKAVEEMAELTAELSRNGALSGEGRFPPIDGRSDLVGEIVDVQIMIDQLELMFHDNTDPGKFDRLRRSKLDRLRIRLEEEEKRTRGNPYPDSNRGPF